jgi:hypothetical protein
MLQQFSHQYRAIQQMLKIVHQKQHVFVREVIQKLLLLGTLAHLKLEADGLCHRADNQILHKIPIGQVRA